MNVKERRLEFRIFSISGAYTWALVSFSSSAASLDMRFDRGCARFFFGTSVAAQLMSAV